MPSRIEELIDAEDWPAARKTIRVALRSSPKDHWLLTRLGLTYYEERRYQLALKYERRALEEVPECPLALWDFAGSLAMLDQTGAAANIYRDLIRRGVSSIAFGDCGEGMAWARGLVADCHYRLAHCYVELRQNKRALTELQHHIAARGPGCRSIYDLAQVRRELKQLERK